MRFILVGGKLFIQLVNLVKLFPKQSLMHLDFSNVALLGVALGIH